MINWTACHEYASAIANGTTPMVAKPTDYDNAVMYALGLAESLKNANSTGGALEIVNNFLW